MLTSRPMLTSAFLVQRVVILAWLWVVQQFVRNWELR